MDSHVHLFFKSGQQGISAVMRKLLTWYAQYFDWKKRDDGDRDYKATQDTTLYIDLSKGKTFKDGIEKIIFLCSGFYRKKKPPVRNKSMFHQTQILKQEVYHERRRSYQVGGVSSIPEGDSEIYGVFDRWH